MNKERIKSQVIKTLENYCNAGNKLFLPVPIKAITRSIPNVRLITYSKYMKKLGISAKEMYQLSGTNDAYTDYSVATNQYLICYNDLDKTIMRSYRYRWSIAHELGHVVLKHHLNKNTRLFRRDLSNRDYKILEQEADCFASYILVPYSVLSRFEEQMDSIEQINKFCWISKKASEVRFENYLLWKRKNGWLSPFDRNLLRLFYHFNICNQCKNKFSDLWSYCSICGSRAVNRIYYPKIKTEVQMKYNDYEMKDGILKECLNCHNELLVDGSTYCHICGKPVKNLCMSEMDMGQPVQCEAATLHPLPANARYCPYCGNNTLFRYADLLPDWESENNISSSTEDFPF